MKLPAWSAPLAIFLFSSGLLLFTLPDYGVTWDEAYPNLPAARRHAQWFAGFLTHPALFSEQTIRDHWQSTSDHPTLVRTLAAFGILFLGKFFSEPTAARIPLALAFSAFLVVVYEWLRRQCGSVWPAAWAALALLFFPRIFAHAHFAALDLPMAMMWVGMLWVFLWARAPAVGCAPRTAALRRPRTPTLSPRERELWNHAAAAGLFYGLVLATKLHALFLPLVLLIHNLRYRRFDWRIYLMMALLGPPVYVLVQPILWHHPIATTLDRLAGLGGKVESGPIPLYYLGEVHYGDTPWHYPLVMTLVTFPLPILALLALAAGAGLRRWWGRAARYATTTAAGGDAEARPSISPPAYSGVAIAAAIEARRRRLSETPRSEWVFTFLVSAAVSFGIVLLPKAQAYDGLRLILPGVVSLVLLSSLGFSRLVAWSVVRVGWLPWRYLSRVPAVLLFALLLPGAFSTLARHPWQLSHYNLLGAAVGLDQFETAYWCEGLSRAAAADLNRRLKQDATLWVVAGSWDQIRYYQEQGWLRRDILLPPEAQPPFDYHLLQVRQGMFQRLGWELYRHGKRVAEYGPPGRPVYILYGSLEEALRGS